MQPPCTLPQQGGVRWRVLTMSAISNQNAKARSSDHLCPFRQIPVVRMSSHRHMRCWLEVRVGRRKLCGVVTKCLKVQKRETRCRPTSLLRNWKHRRKKQRTQKRGMREQRSRMRRNGQTCPRESCATRCRLKATEWSKIDHETKIAKRLTNLPNRPHVHRRKWLHRCQGR